MDIGMLWFDNDPKSDFFSKVKRAADYYQSKYGERPNLCFVHPSMIPEVTAHSENIDVRSNSSMIPHHLWIGVQQQTQSSL